jgi:hypothetical protein
LQIPGAQIVNTKVPPCRPMTEVYPTCRLAAICGLLRKSRRMNMIRRQARNRISSATCRCRYDFEMGRWEQGAVEVENVVHSRVSIPAHLRCAGWKESKQPQYETEHKTCPTAHDPETVHQSQLGFQEFIRVGIRKRGSPITRFVFAKIPKLRPETRVRWCSLVRRGSNQTPASRLRQL